MSTPPGPTSPLDALSPAPLWRAFADICRRPHGSRREEPLRRYIIDTCVTLGLHVESDPAGNLLIRKDATPGCEVGVPVVLQAHLDMVCEKNEGTIHDFTVDPIVPEVRGAWVQARGTSLGADNGIGVAAILALLAAGRVPDPELDGIRHGPLEALLTVDEETGLTGVMALAPGWFRGRLLLNLDNEYDDNVCIGCAGSQTTFGHLPFRPEPAPPLHGVFQLSVSGLTGGHSGLDIHLGRGNANRILGRLLLAASTRHGARLAWIGGGTRRNAIPREASALLLVPLPEVDALRRDLHALGRQVGAEQAVADPALDVAFRSWAGRAPSTVMNLSAQERLLHLLCCIPDGVRALDPEIPGLVRASSNLGTLEMEDRRVTLGTSQRAQDDGEKAWVASTVEAAFRLAGASVTTGGTYPGWRPRLDAPLLAVVRDVYVRQRGAEPRVGALHAGLECGILKEKAPDLDQVSIGPTVESPHSPDERVDIASVGRFWDLVLGILAHPAILGPAAAPGRTP